MNSKFAALVVGCAVLAIPALEGGIFGKIFPIDFVAFWCAGNATLHGLNPYLDGSLHACETHMGLLPSLTVPVPYPPYDMALFAAAATIAQDVAFALYCLFATAAAAIAGLATARVAGTAAYLAIAAFALTLLIPSVPFGQVAPFAVCGLTCALLWIRDDRPVAAALGLTAAAIVPSLALPAWIGAFVAIPRIRIPLAACGLALIAISVGIAGPGVCLQYVGEVLPAHALSEMSGWGQLGSTPLLYSLLRVPQVAAALAYVVFGAFVAAGAILGFRLARRFGGPQWVVAATAAFGTIGSPFLHGHDVGFTAPLALMLAAGGGSTAAWAAILVLTPWQTLLYSGGTPAAICYPLLYITADGILGLRPLATGAFVAAVAALTIPVVRLQPGLPTPATIASRLGTAPSPRALAEERWAALNRQIGLTPIAWYERALVDGAFALLVVAAIGSTSLGRRV